MSQQNKVEEHNNQQQRNVRFNSTVLVHEELHLNDYTDEEMITTWYTIDDRMKSFLEIKKTIDLIKCGEFFINHNTEDMYCQRGLESNFRGITEQKQRRKIHAVVLKIQELYKRGKCDIDMISRVYSFHCQQSRKDAYIRGMKDQCEVLHPTTTTTTMKTATSKNNNNTFMKDAGPIVFNNDDTNSHGSPKTTSRADIYSRAA